MRGLRSGLPSAADVWGTLAHTGSHYVRVNGSQNTHLACDEQWSVTVCKSLLCENTVSHLHHLKDSCTEHTGRGKTRKRDDLHKNIQTAHFHNAKTLRDQICSSRKASKTARHLRSALLTWRLAKSNAREVCCAKPGGLPKRVGVRQ